MTALADPRHKLMLIISRYENGHLPKKAGGWAENALTTAESIIATMDDMEMNGQDVPTPGQATALRNIDRAASGWLRMGVDDEDED